MSDKLRQAARNALEYIRARNLGEPADGVALTLESALAAEQQQPIHQDECPTCGSMAGMFDDGVTLDEAMETLRDIKRHEANAISGTRIATGYKNLSTALGTVKGDFERASALIAHHDAAKEKS